MFYIRIPYSLDKNLGAAYNLEMELLPNDDDWAVLMDTDTMFMDNAQPQFFEKAIAAKPNAGMFTCYASRTGMVNQRFNDNAYANSPDLTLHRSLSITQLQKPLRLKQINGPIAGFCMAIKKSTWKQIGRFEEKGLLSIDTNYSRRVIASGLKIFLIENIYLLHYYRLMEGSQNKNHLL